MKCLESCTSGSSKRPADDEARAASEAVAAMEVAHISSCANAATKLGEKKKGGGGGEGKTRDVKSKNEAFFLCLLIPYTWYTIYTVHINCSLKSFYGGGGGEGSVASRPVAVAQPAKKYVSFHLLHDSNASLASSPTYMSLSSLRCPTTMTTTQVHVKRVSKTEQWLSYYGSPS